MGFYEHYQNYFIIFTQVSPTPVQGFILVLNLDWLNEEITISY